MRLKIVLLDFFVTNIRKRISEFTGIIAINCITNDVLSLSNVLVVACRIEAEKFVGFWFNSLPLHYWH